MLQLIQNLCKLQLLNISGLSHPPAFIVNFNRSTETNPEILGNFHRFPPQFLGFSAPSVPNAATSASQEETWSNIKTVGSAGCKRKTSEPMQCGNNMIIMYIYTTWYLWTSKKVSIYTKSDLFISTWYLNIAFILMSFKNSRSGVLRKSICQHLRKPCYWKEQ